MTVPLRFAHLGVHTATPAAYAAPTCRVNPVVRVALSLFVLSIPFEIPNRTLPAEIPTLTGLLFLATTVLQPSVCYRRIPTAIVWFALHIWILALAAVRIDAEHSTLVFRHFVGFVEVLLVAWVLTNILADRRVVRDVLLTLVAACMARGLIQVLGIARTSYTIWGGGERVTAFGQNANLSAMILGAGLITAVGLLATHERWLPRFGPLTWPIAGVIGLALIQSGSRGGLACAGAGLATLCLTGRTFTHRVRNAALGLVALGTLAWGAARSEVVRHRFEEAGVQGNLAGRERIYPAMFEMFRERPVFGWGPVQNQFEVVGRIADRHHASRDAHNLVLELLTTTGVVGAVPFLIGLGLCVRSGWRARHGALGLLPLAAMVGVLMGTISGTWITAKILWLTFALALAAGTWWSRSTPDGQGVQACAA